MDNVEVLSAQRAIAGLLRERGDPAGARRWQQRSERLALAIEQVFAGVDTLAPAVTAGAASLGQEGRGDGEQDRARSAAGGIATPFYPDAVAAPFAWLHGVPRRRTAARFDAWLTRNGQAWRDNAQHDYPWGLIALAAVQEGRPDIAALWRQAQEQQRSGGLWNVLEEAAWQALDPAHAGRAQARPAARASAQPRRGAARALQSSPLPSGAGASRAQHALASG